MSILEEAVRLQQKYPAPESADEERRQIGCGSNTEPGQVQSETANPRRFMAEWPGEQRQQAAFLSAAPAVQVHRQTEAWEEFFSAAAAETLDRAFSRDSRRYDRSLSTCE